MNNIIQFPQGTQRTIFKRKIVLSKWKTLLVNALYFFMKTIRGLWFFFRLTIASTFHTVTMGMFHILHAFKRFLFFFCSIGCIITYFHLGKNFIATGNYTIPFLIVLWAMGCIGEEVRLTMNNSVPFHQMFKVTKKHLILSVGKSAHS